MRLRSVSTLQARSPAPGANLAGLVLGNGALGTRSTGQAAPFGVKPVAIQELCSTQKRLGAKPASGPRWSFRKPYRAASMERAQPCGEDVTEGEMKRVALWRAERSSACGHWATTNP